MSDLLRELSAIDDEQVIAENIDELKIKDVYLWQDAIKEWKKKAEIQDVESIEMYLKEFKRGYNEYHMSTNNWLKDSKLLYHSFSSIKNSPNNLQLARSMIAVNLFDKKIEPSI